jgi:hypothetical protein
VSDELFDEYMHEMISHLLDPENYSDFAYVLYGKHTYPRFRCSERLIPMGEVIFKRRSDGSEQYAILRKALKPSDRL